MCIDALQYKLLRVRTLLTGKGAAKVKLTGVSGCVTTDGGLFIEGSNTNSLGAVSSIVNLHHCVVLNGTGLVS